MTDRRERRRVRVVPGGPVLVEGPLELTGTDGETVVADRFVVAVCVCRRSKCYPLCDTSHRRRVRTGTTDMDVDMVTDDAGLP